LRSASTGRKLRGVVFSGSGEGAAYVELYRDQIALVLGSAPHPGTLNVALDACFQDFVEVEKLVTINPPKQGLGAVLACRGLLMGIPVLVIKPTITRHGCNVVEVVSAVNLRKHFELRDGDVVEITLLC